MSVCREPKQCKDKCCKCRKPIQGLYKGFFRLPAAGVVEPILYNFDASGTVTITGQLEYPANPGFTDLETPILGQYRRKCNGDVVVWTIQIRQAADNNGVPGAFGYNNTQIPSLPNYVIIGTTTIRFSDHDRSFTTTQAAYGFADSNWTEQNGLPVFPFSNADYLPSTFDGQLQTYCGIKNAVPLGPPVPPA